MDWTPFLPPYDSQVSFPTHTDFDNCVSQSAVHIIETILKFINGLAKHYSPRALGKLSGTTTQGNSLQNVIDAINKYGLIPYDAWPDPGNLTWDQYYADIPQSVLAQADKFQVSFESATDTDLATTPLWIIVAVGRTTHIIEQINETQIFDSETDSQQNAIRPLTTYGAILSRYKINLKGTQMNLIKDQGTVYLVSSDQKSKIGIGNGDVLTGFFPTEPIADGDTSHIPQIGTLADGVILHK